MFVVGEQVRTVEETAVGVRFDVPQFGFPVPHPSDSRVGNQMIEVRPILEVFRKKWLLLKPVSVERSCGK
jgi:hypothetical protein